MRIVLSRGFVAGLLITVGTLAQADDWYRWRGPDLNGISKETGWYKPWGSEGPKQVWKTKVEAGFSSVTVAKGRVFTAGSANKKETIFCLDEKTGEVIWKHTYATKFVPEYYEGGSSGTPTIDGDRAYHLGQMGELFCFDAATGKVIWSNQIAQAVGSKPPTWGFTGAPFVHDEMLVVNVGPSGSAVEKTTGKLIWSSKGEGGYATPVPFQGNLLIVSTKALQGVEAKGGRVIWEFPWPTRYDVNAADPVIISTDRVLISSGYEHGAALVEIKNNRARQIWQSKTMRNHFNASVVLKTHAYGIDGDAGKRGSGVACVEVETGKSKWREPSLGSGALMAADDKLIILSEKGELVIAEASPDAFKPLSRAQILGGKIWTVPVLSNGKIYCRNSIGDLVCVDASK